MNWDDVLGDVTTDEIVKAIRPLRMPSRRVMMQYGFPVLALDPGEERTVSVDVKGVFRSEKLLMVGTMDEIRGHFHIKRTLLPDLDRDDVVAYTRVYRRRGKFWPGKTTVEFSGFDGGAREYLPASVEYHHTDPLEYIALLNLKIGAEPTMPDCGGTSAVFFGAGVLGNSMWLPTAENVSASLILKNHGDIQVRVNAALMGVGMQVEWGK